MKKIKKLLSVVLCCLMAVSMVHFALSANAENYSYSGNVVYISDNGSDENDGKTPENAVATAARAAKLGSTVVIVDKYTSKDMTKISVERLAGYNSESKLVSDFWALCFGCDITLENLEICALKEYSYILAYGNSLTIGENVRVGGEGFGIRGGGEGTYIGKDTNIVLKSGKWKDVHGGTRNAPVNGSTYVTVYEGAEVSRINIGNNASRETDTISGNGCIKLVGNPVVSAINEKPQNLDGEMLLELTEFTGSIKEEWFSLGARIATEKRDVPDYAAEHYKTVSGDYDLSEIKGQIRYISDNGSAENDGLTRQTAMNDLSAAVKSMGDEGGTIIITGSYTHDEFNPNLPPFDLTSASADDKFIQTVWSLHTNNTHIYNLHIVIAKNSGFILHQGTPLVIGENVRCSFTDGATTPLSIRGNEFGDVAMTDITVKSGSWGSIFTGTKNANVLGNSNVTVEGGSVGAIAVGNNSAAGRILGNTTVTIKGNPTVSSVSDRNQCDGYTVVDISGLEGKMPSISEGLTVISDKSDAFIPINGNSAFINGYPDGTFLPEKLMTRAEAVSVVSKIAGFNEFSVLPPKSAFSDVTDGDWYEKNVRYLEGLGMLSFLGDKFDASKEITRGEFVKLISKMVKEAEGQTPRFTDVSLSYPYIDEIILCAKKGLVNGYPDGSFKPDNGLKRCEIVTVLSRLVERNAVVANTARLESFSDIKGHWAQAAVSAASSQSTVDGMLIWYKGEQVAGNSNVDKAGLSLDLAEKILANAKTKQSADISASVEAYAAEKRKAVLESKTEVTVTGTSYYVSSDGSDENDGKTPETAWKTVNRVNEAKLSAGDGVFFRRGDIFREQLKATDGVTYSAYGEGEKPAFYGSERVVGGSDFWQKTERENVYVSSKAFSEDVGLIVFDGGKAWSDKCVIGLKGFDGGLDGLTSDLQMFHGTSDKKLYLYSVSDPDTRFDEYEIALGRSAITGKGSNITVDNIAVKYAGAHALGFGGGTEGLTVQNCEIGWIGGKIQYGSVRYGNAIEIYGSCRDFTVRDCYIYQVYDAGITHQYFNTSADYAANPDYEAVMQNVLYTGNIIEDCSYGIEYVNALPYDRGVMKSIEFSHNLLLRSGEGWGIQRPDRREAAIKGWSEENRAEGFVIYDNVIATSSAACHLVHMGVGNVRSIPELYGNIFIGKRNAAFGIYGLKTESTAIRLTESIKDTTVGLDDNTFVLFE